MKVLLVLVFAGIIITSCSEREAKKALPQLNLEERSAVIRPADSLIQGKSYLPVYSQIYHYKSNETVDLTITTSLKNVSPRDTVYILRADLYNSVGTEVRSYTNEPFYLAPLETLDIIIEELDKEGGTGGNFIFEWAIAEERNPPLFEAVMISTLGQQGISFTSRAVRIYD